MYIYYIYINVHLFYICMFINAYIIYINKCVRAHLLMEGNVTIGGVVLNIFFAKSNRVIAKN